VGPEFLVHRDNAWIVDYASSEAIHQGLRSLLEDPALRETFVERGRESIRRFDYRQMVRNLEAFYHRVAPAQRG
jgi:glycosyltransferase involved in cell wall biosynthesis